MKLIPGSKLATSLVLAIVVATAAGIPGAAGDVVVLTPSRDNTLYETMDGSVSNGAGTAMYAGRNAQPANSRRRAVLAFDIAGSIPAGATIDSVTLTLNESSANLDPAMVSLHRLLADWGEGSSFAGGGQGSGGPSTTGDATWLHRFFDSELWITPGGDFVPLASTQAIVAGLGMHTWSSAPQFVDDVQMLLDQPAANFGWLVLGNESSPSTAKRFSTREEPDPALRPMLTVAYTPIPEPATQILLILGLTWLRRGARRAGAFGQAGQRGVCTTAPSLRTVAPG